MYKTILWGAQERYVGTLDYTAEFLGADRPTRFYLYWMRESGRPFSFTYDSNIIEMVIEMKEIFGIPTGPNDPLVSFSDGTGDAFYAFVDKHLGRYKGKVAANRSLLLGKQDMI